MFKNSLELVKNMMQIRMLP